MDTFDGPNGFVGRGVVFRPIQFERYRKPCVTSYPRHAVVLNPHHTRELSRSIKADHHNGGDAFGDSAEFRQETADDADDDDDPLDLEDGMKLCRDEQLRQLLHLRWRHIGPRGGGLQNVGNTCFVNGVLQAIAYTPALAQYFAAAFKSPCSHATGGSCDYAYALGETVRRIHAAANGTYRPGLIVSNLKAFSPHFRLGHQGDAHEFMLHLMHVCHRSILFRHVGSRKVAHHVEHTSALHRIVGGYLCSVVAWSKQEEIDRLTRTGKVQEATDLQMNSRGHSGGGVLVSKTYDPFVTLSVEVVGQTLSHCLAKLTEEERLDGRSYISPRGVGVRATKRFQIHKLPPVLIIHLKRFDCRGGKVSRIIQYPKVLDLTPFCTDKGIKKVAGYCGASGREGSGRSCLYELNAICVHEGSSINYGHYFSVVRARNGTWLLCNDERVSHCDEKYALRQQAFMLFYSLMEPSSLPAAAPAEGNNARVSEDLARHHMAAATTPATVAVSRPLRNYEEEELGRQLRDDEVERILKKKRAAEQLALKQMDSTNDHPQQSASNGQSGARTDDDDDDDGDGDDDDDDDDGDGDDDDDDDDGDDSSGGEDVYDVPRLLDNGRSDRDASSSPPATVKKAEAAAKTENGHLKSTRYGGILKAVRRLRQPATAAASQSTNGGESEVVGSRVVAVVENTTRRNVPVTVARPMHAPKFRQRVRDPLWENEMDRGRVKRVRVKPEEHTGENKFQKANIEFDSRGRRRQ